MMRDGVRLAAGCARWDDGDTIRYSLGAWRWLLGLAVLAVLTGAVVVVGCSRIVPPPPEVVPTECWQTISPEAAGWSVEGLQRAQAYAERIGSGPVMVVVHG